MYTPVVFQKGLTISSSFLNTFQGAVSSISTTVDGLTASILTLVNDGVTGVVSALQPAHDAILAKGGGVLYITAKTTSDPFIWEKTFFVDPRVKIIWPGKGLADFKVIDHFPLATYRYRNGTTGVVSTTTLPARCCIYSIPYAPFNPTGLVITPSTSGSQPYFEGFSVDGNSANQDDVVYGIYAAVGKSDPNWPYVAGAFSVNQVTNPGQGSINLNADAQAYYAFRTQAVEFFNLSGTGFFAGADRQRAHLDMETRCVGSGVNNSDGTVKWLSRGFDIQGNDGFIAPGVGFGGNNGACQGAGESGMMRVQGNFFSPKGNDAASITTRDEAVNGSMNVCNVINGLARLECSSGNAIKARGGGYVGNNFLWGGNMQSTGPNAGRPTGVTTDEGDTYLQFSGYEQTVAVGNVFSVGTDGSTPKYHISATSGAGVMAWNPATTNPDGTQSYRGTSPWYTDNTQGCIGGGWIDPYAKILHIGVQYNGIFATNNVTTTQLVQFDTPVYATQGIVGQTGAAVPSAGYQAERFFTSGTIASPTTNVTADATSITLHGPLEMDLYASVQWTVGGTATTAATNAVFEASLSTTSATLDTSSSRVYSGITLPIQTGLQNQPLVGLRVGPIAVNLTQGNSVTYYLSTRGKFSTNATIAASGNINGRRW